MPDNATGQVQRSDATAQTSPTAGGARLAQSYTQVPIHVTVEQPHSWLDILGNPISWALVLAGWYYVSRHDDWNEHRREVRRSYEDIASIIEKVERAARSYYQISGDNPKAEDLAMDIKRDLGKLGMYIELLRKKCGDIDCRNELTALRIEVTGGQFEVRARVALGATDAKFLAIGVAADDLSETLESKFETRFSKRRWFRRQ